MTPLKNLAKPCRDLIPKNTCGPQSVGLDSQPRMKRGTIREDGMVFLKYANSCKNGQQWVTQEEYSKRIARQKDKAAEWRKRNREKARGYYRGWLVNNRPKAREACKRWASKNAEKRKRDFRLWAKNNRDKIKASYKRNRDSILNNIKKRRKSDVVYAVKALIRSRMSHSTRRKKLRAPSISESMLGCSWEFFVSWVESQFTAGMSWDKRDAWHLDHIIPLNLATTVEEIVTLNHYSNLRPLWSTDNLSKGRKIPDEIPDSIHPSVKLLLDKKKQTLSVASTL